MKQAQQVDMREGALWACRLLLGREPDDVKAIETMIANCDTPVSLREMVLRSREYGNKFENVGRIHGSPRFPVDLKQGVIWAYRLYFQQEPNEAQIDYQLQRVNSIADIRGCFLLSKEFELMNGYGAPDLLTIEVLRRFAPFCDTPAPPGFFNDFLGAKTRISYLPAAYGAKSGTVEGPPNSSRQGMHGPAEWLGTLKSVLEARGELVAVELGAGWAPWLVTVAVAAQKLGIKDVRLIGVEGSLEHVEFCRQHFRDNGLDPDAHQIVHAVAGACDGVARFPKLLDPSDHYGANAAFDGEETGAGAGLGAWEEIPSLSLETILKGVERVDILHCDIQGAETQVFTPAMPRLGESTRRIVVGTHSRKIESELLDLFSENGWDLEHEQPCLIKQHRDGRIMLMRDGEQIWRNRSLS